MCPQTVKFNNADYRFCYRDIFGFQLPECNIGFWYYCVINEFTFGSGEKIEVCDYGIPGQLKLQLANYIHMMTCLLHCRINVKFTT